MKTLVFSDIHGNAVALEAMLADIERRGERFDQTVCLGDAIQGGLQPSEVVARLRAMGCPIVMGNADDWLLTGQDSGAEAISEERRKRLDAIRDWQLARLSRDDIAFIQSFQPTIELTLDAGRTLLCFHGSPKSFDDVILPSTADEVVRGFLEPQPQRIYCGGHTHVQFIRHFGRTFHFNPGSVGVAFRHDQPEDHFRRDPWAEYVVLTVDGGQIDLSFRRVPFDVAQLIELYRDRGVPYAETTIGELTAP